MTIGTLTSELQWTAVFAANLVATLPHWTLRALGVAIAGAWIGARSLRKGSAAQRTLAIAVPILVLPLLALLITASASADLLADATLERQQQVLIAGSVMLLIEGVGLAAFATLLGSLLRSGAMRTG